MPVSTRSRASRPRSGLSRMLAAVAAALMAGALALAPAVGASAHDYLVDSTPKANSTQTTPLKSVSLTFDDIVLDLSHNGSSALLQVTGPDGASRHFETGCPTITGRVISTPVSLGASGKYTMTWQIVSADGHTVSDSIVFTYAPPPGTPAAKGAPGRPDCGRAGSAPNATAPTQASPAPTATSGSGSLGIVIAIAGVIVGLAIIGVVVVLLTARRKPGTAGRAPNRAPDDD